MMIASVVSSVTDRLDGLTLAPDADVIVIGAGLSGLCAARALHDAGRKVIVLEARDRVSDENRALCARAVLKIRSEGRHSLSRVDLGDASMWEAHG
jgi:monoamine oxidase